MLQNFKKYSIIDIAANRSLRKSEVFAICFAKACGGVRLL